MEEGKPTERVEVSEGIRNLAAAMEGLPNAGTILAKVATEGVKEGLIKTVKVENEIAGNPSTVQTSKEPLMRSEENANDKGDNKGAAAATNTAAAADDKGAASNTATNDDNDGGEDENNPILKSLGGNKKNKLAAFENFDQIKAVVKKDFGIEIKNETDFGKLLNSSKTWREAAVKVPELEEKITQFNEIFENMPAPLLNSMQDYFNAKPDWDRHIVERPRFDFTKPVEKQKVEDLVMHYFPGEFKEEDFTADEKPAALKIAEKAAKDRFNSDKLELENASATQMRLSQARIDARKTSINGSLTTLKQSFPDIDKAEEKRLTKILESGDINSLFFNKDGSYKPTAAKMLFLAEYGEGAIENLMKISAKRAESKANEEILDRGADKPKPDKGGAADQDAVKVKKVIEGMTNGLNRKTTY